MTKILAVGALRRLEYLSALKPVRLTVLLIPNFLL